MAFRFGALFLALLAVGAGFTEAVTAFGDAQQRGIFERYTSTAAAALEPEVVAGFQGIPADAGTPAFDVVRAELRRIRAAAPNARFVYLMAKKDGKWLFLADAEDLNSPDYSPPGELYTGEVTSLDRVLASGSPTVVGPSRDSWGVWVTGEAPIKDPHSGKTIAVFGIDIAADAWAGEVQRYRLFGLSISGLFIIVIGLSAVGLFVQSRRREAQAQLAAIVDSTHEAIIGGDTDGICTSWNMGAERIYGYRANEMLGRSVATLVPEERQQELRDQIATVLSGGDIVSNETIRIRKDGQSIDVSETISPIRNPSGVIVGASALVVDITKRRRADEALRASEEKYRGLFEVTRDAIMTIDPPSWKFTSGNPAAIKMFGASKEAEFVLYGPWELSPEVQPDGRASAEKAKEMIETAMREGSHYFEWTHRRIDGREFFADVLLNRMVQGERAMLHATVRDISERKRAEQALQRTTRALKTLGQANEAMIRATSRDGLFQEMCRVSVEVGGYRMAWIGLVENDPDKSVRPVARAGYDAGYVDLARISWADSERGRGPTGTAIRTGLVQVNRDIASNPSTIVWRADALKRGYASSIALPLREAEHVFGAFMIYASEADAFVAEEVSLLTELAGDLSYGVVALRARTDREVALQRLERAMEETVQAVASTVEMRDAYTAGHQRRVTRIAEAIAVQMGLSEDRIHGLRLASSVHDLGKIHIPAEILSKPGKLSPIEYKLIQTHPQVGYDILKPVTFPWRIADIILQHHERLDGSGYPNGLRGDAILLEARIMAVADVVESMTSHRPYRPALGLDIALAEIQQGSGRLYDPAVVDACLKLFREGKFKFE